MKSKKTRMVFSKFTDGTAHTFIMWKTHWDFTTAIKMYMWDFKKAIEQKDNAIDSLHNGLLIFQLIKSKLEWFPSVLLMLLSRSEPVRRSHSSSSRPISNWFYH